MKLADALIPTILVVTSPPALLAYLLFFVGFQIRGAS